MFPPPLEESAMVAYCLIKFKKGYVWIETISVHPETVYMSVILRSKAAKNLIVAGSSEILRFAQNDREDFPDGN
jgi:hypothetical protein